MREILFLAIISGVLRTAMSQADLAVDKCYCYSDTAQWADLKEFVDPVFNTGSMDTYTGVMVDEKGKKKPCVCTDVTLFYSVMDVKDENVVEDATYNQTQPLAIKTMNKKVEFLRQSMIGKYPELGDPFYIINIPSILEVDQVNTNVRFRVEFILMGQDAAKETTVKAAFIEATNILLDDGSTVIGIKPGPDPILYIDRADTESLFTLSQCSGDPVAAPANGKRDWNNAKLGGASANYFCNEGYILENDTQSMSLCLHSTKTWSTVNPICIEGCAEDLPQGPVFTIPDWVDEERKEGTEVGYFCRKRYRSSDGTNATVTCTNGNWTAIQKTDTFACEEIVCFLEDMPYPLPSWAIILKWNNEQGDGTKVEYGCKSGYKPYLGYNAMIECKDTKWGHLPRGWRCVANSVLIQSEVLARRAEEARKLAELTDEELADKALLEEGKNYFLLTTVPTIAVFGFIILFCMICTRHNSPICKLCTDRRKKNIFNGLPA